MTIEVQVDSLELERWLKRREREFPKLAVAVVEKAVSLHQAQMVRNVSAKTGGGLRRRTGALGRSMRRTPARERSRGFEASSRVGRGAPYAAIHEDGGTIRPKRSRFLTVAFGPALTAAGVPRKAAALERSGGGFRTRGRVPGASGRRTFILRSGSQAIIAVPGAGDRVVPLYVLKRSVRIQPRLGFVRTWRQQKGKRDKAMRREAQKFIRGVR